MLEKKKQREHREEEKKLRFEQSQEEMKRIMNNRYIYLTHSLKPKKKEPANIVNKSQRITKHDLIEHRKRINSFRNERSLSKSRQ